MGAKVQLKIKKTKMQNEKISDPVRFSAAGTDNAPENCYLPRFRIE